MTQHDKLLHAYIRSSRPPKGNWHVNVPAGLSIAEKQVKRSNTEKFSKQAFANFAMNQAKEIDAICVTSQSNNHKEAWSSLDRDNKIYFKGDVFDGERVILVEAKTKKNGIIQRDRPIRGIRCSLF